MSDKTFVLIKANKPLGAAFSHARKVAAKTGGGKKKQREVANRYLDKHGDKPIGKSECEAEAFDVLGDYVCKAGKSGPGSRGGKVIRILGNGKAVYQTKAGTDDVYAHFGHQDHLDARDAHHEQIDKHRATIMDANASPEDKKRAEAARQRHAHNAGRHRLMAQVLDQNRTGAASYAKQAEAAAVGKPDDDGALMHTAGYYRHQADKAELAYHGSAEPKRMTKSQTTQDSDMEACDLLTNYLSKAGKKGEGSRGGHIISHTSSGAPIYASKNASHEAYHNFTAAEHHEAFDAHVRAMHGNRYEDTKAANSHRTKAMQHVLEAAKKKGGAKLPAASVVAHTESGKQIHAAYSKKYYGKLAERDRTHTNDQADEHDKANGVHVKAAYPKFTALDHIDAAKMHENTNNHNEAGAHFAAAGWHDPETPEKQKLYDHYKKSEDVAPDLVKSDWTACDVLGAYTAGAELSKATKGEGSRGGKIIGHTASGAVYAKHQSFHSHYANFTPGDHKKAARMLFDKAKTQKDMGASSDTYSAGTGHMMMAHHKESGKSHASYTDATAKSMDAGFGDNAQQFADEHNLNNEMIQVRAVDDLNQSALNDAIAAAWPGRPYMGNSAASFCAMANNMNYKTGV